MQAKENWPAVKLTDRHRRLLRTGKGPFFHYVEQIRWGNSFTIIRDNLHILYFSSVYPVPPILYLSTYLVDVVKERPPKVKDVSPSYILRLKNIMVQRMHPRGVVRGAFFPPPVEIWKK